MQHYEDKNTVKNKKITKSKVRYQKSLPTYVVAFAVQETYDEPPTERQKLCKKRSLSEIISPITPTASNKMVALDSKSVQGLNQKSDTYQRYNEIKIDIIEEHDKQSGDVKKDPPQTTVYIADNNIAEDSFNIQPQILFDSSKNKPRIARKKSKKSNHNVKYKNMNFKTKNNNIKKKIEQYYLKGKHNSANTQIQKDLCSVAISNLLSRTRFLKNAHTTENLLEVAGLNNDYEELDYSSNENESMFSGSTSKFLFKDSSSHNTLTRDSSGTAIHSDEDFFNNDAVSVKSVLSPEATSPYKSDIINVAVAYNTGMHNAENRCAEKKRYSFGNLTSTETLIAESGSLTSKSPFDDSKIHENPQVVNVIQQDFSDRTLQGEMTISEQTIIYDEFITAKTSWDFQKPSFESAYIEARLGSYEPIICDKDKFPPQIVDSESVRANSVHSNRNGIFDAVINLGIYPELVPSTSSAGEFKDSFENHVIVTDTQPSLFVTDKHASVPQTNAKTFERSKKCRNIFKKYHHNNLKNISAHKNLSLPNNAAIKAMLDNSDLRKKNFEVLDPASKPDVPRSMPELWERLTFVLDSAIKRLEQTLAEKIIKEIKSKSFSDSLPIPQTNKVQSHIITANKSLDIKLSVLKTSEDKEVLVKQESVTIIDGDKNFQCDLIESKVIDQLMLRLSFEHPKALVSHESPLKILKAPRTSDRLKEPQILKKCYELLNPPSSETQTLDDIKPAEISATATLMSNNTAVRLRTLSSRLKGALVTPTVFFKENALVITTVPVFFLGLLTLYSLIALAAKL